MFSINEMAATPTPGTNQTRYVAESLRAGLRRPASYPVADDSIRSRGKRMKRANLYSVREAAQVLGLSYSALKQWIYKRKIKTVKTVGGHHRVPESELDRFLYRSSQTGEIAGRRTNFRGLSGRNQLVGRILDIKVDGFIAQVRLSIGGQQITSLITADAVRELRLRKGQTAAAVIKSTSVMVVRP